ncbi:conserved hypothetical protein [Leishmania major strain Friedlin]|uniref:Uncharacterized protein n=1 Tax=Leishmania major TaxID=5664 RepID=Q4Q8Y4_LEIMA|nr:conserved hypothetical protein [Leishmania major strain Friedlin]CAG9576533.1 hypothetical_protein_-_conserved [Leishmania major strain Friedlin]CAJ05518.1 conserved hypothetical protein [Leishmania major strain Friedlin]|eukprot:XP_001684214.1 conserved hypothetical protein [Leishmania major strain Friedlin]
MCGRDPSPCTVKHTFHPSPPLRPHPRHSSQEAKQNTKRRNTTKAALPKPESRETKTKTKMGGESSKHSNASAHVRSRERKRGAVSSALAGDSCRTDSCHERTAHLRPSYGDILDSIPPSPVQCVASPIPLSGSLDPSLTWILDTEAALITEWNRDLQEVAAPSTGARGVPRGREAAAEESTLSWTKTSLKSGPSTAASNTPGLTSSSTFPALSGWPSPTHAKSPSGLALTCDSVDVRTGRSTGLTLRVTTTWTQQSSSRAKASTKESTSPKSPKALPKPLSDSVEGASPLVVSSLPVGIDYFRALQSRWLVQEQRSLPPATDEEDLNDSVILEAVSESNGDVLSPPVPLGYMIDLFVPQWRSEGLFEAAQDHQMR